MTYIVQNDTGAEQQVGRCLVADGATIDIHADIEPECVQGLRVFPLDKSLTAALDDEDFSLIEDVPRSFAGCQPGLPSPATSLVGMTPVALPPTLVVAAHTWTTLVTMPISEGVVFRCYLELFGGLGDAADPKPVDARAFGSAVRATGGDPNPERLLVIGPGYGQIRLELKRSGNDLIVRLRSHRAGTITFDAASFCVRKELAL